MNIERLSALIGAYYAASVDPERWPDAAARTAHFFASESTAIQVCAGDFSSIAFRATDGFLTSAAEAGASVWKLAEVSRHRSLNTPRGYVRRIDLFKEHTGAASP
jgi:hypothetical protein